MLGKKIGKWGLLLGAVAKSIPDFDLFYTGLNDPRAYMCEHRAHTHSLIIEALYAIPIAWVLVKLFKEKVAFRQMYLFMMACLWGHSLLDWCTAFGTQLLLPFTDTGYSVNTIAIVDLLFTLPMFALMLIVTFVRKNEARRFKLSKYALLWCGIYLCFTFFNKFRADSFVKGSIAEQHLPAKDHMTNPTMLNNLLWYSVASNDSTLYVGEFSLYAGDGTMRWHKYPRHTELLDDCGSRNDAEVMKWFGGPYTVSEKNGDTLNVFAVKFGRSDMRETELHRSFIFHYKLWQENGKEIMGMHQLRPRGSEMKAQLKDLWERICGKDDLSTGSELIP